jgi:hypothetical protein
MSLPVSSGNYIYSHFKHVSGTPAPEGTHGVTINKLKILDVLIEQLSQIKKRPELSTDFSMSDNQIDALIEQYENQLRQVRAVNSAMPYTPTPAAPVGVIFNLAV